MSNAITQAISLLDAFRQRHGTFLDRLRSDGERLQAACQDIQDSWSGSFAGWHGRMYFGDFERPGIGELFSGEWGGIHGIPDGWAEKTADDVALHLFSIMGHGFLVTAFDRDLVSFRADLKDLREEVNLCLCVLGPPPNAKAAQYLADIETKDMGDPRTVYVQRGMPTNLMSRDMEAIRQGTCLPSWLYFAAVAHEAKDTAEWFESYAKTLDRLGRAMTLTTPDEMPVGLGALSVGIHPDILVKCAALYAAGQYAEAVEKGFKTVRDRLRQLTGHETGSEAFGKGKLFIKGAAAPHVETDFNQAAKFLMMSIDQFRNEKSHTSDAAIRDPARANEYLYLSSLALHLLDNSEIRP